ncbi:MAG: sulfurtransferase complex subunit TusB [Burkholderiales bacterium]|nr:sulfurtransferase complex subunit TusB [Burkholderiales bacterium]MDE2297160.1 sulfurtransferase complex subunit TusB [Burkholderiales bacterium]MDE2628052.1 sulfurtransferase complex subunit TusB [Burkholderiales bacterium]
MLHIVNKSPSQTRTLDSCLRLAQAGHALLLIEDAVYAATARSPAAAAVREALGRLKVYALQPDLEARGMQAAVLDGVTLVDYGGFVDLVAEHSVSQSWL